MLSITQLHAAVEALLRLTANAPHQPWCPASFVYATQTEALRFGACQCGRDTVRDLLARLDSARNDVPHAPLCPSDPDGFFVPMPATFATDGTESPDPELRS